MAKNILYLQRLHSMTLFIINALMANKDLWDEIDKQNVFSDVWFNPDKSLNCQAEAMALFRGLKESGNLDKATQSFEDFVNVVFFKS